MKPSVPADFHASVSEDPLVAAEGMDAENASLAIERLDSALRILEREYAAGSFLRRLFFVRYPLSRYAVPVPFLRAFVESETARRQYLSDPTMLHAEALVAAWERAARAYAEGARCHRALQRILVRLESNERIFVIQDAFGYLTSYKHADATLARCEENGRALLREVEGRRALLRGTGSRSAPLPHSRPLPPLTETVMTPRAKRLHAAAMRGGVWPFRGTEVLEEHGPLRYTLTHFDGIPTEHAFLLYVMKDRNGRLKSMWPALVDRFFFLNLWGIAPDEDGVTRGVYASKVGLREEEVPPYWYEAATHLYGSRDYGYWMDIATMVDKLRRPELNARLVETQRSSMFDLLLGECARDTLSMKMHLQRRARSKTAQSYSMLYDLMTRSFPGAYFLPFNRSVWRLPEFPQFLGEKFIPVDPVHRLSESAIDEKLTPEVLEVIMAAQKRREDAGRAAGWFE